MVDLTVHIRGFQGYVGLIIIIFHEEDGKFKKFLHIDFLI